MNIKTSISNNPSVGEFVWPGAWLTADGWTGVGLTGGRPIWLATIIRY